MTVSHPRVLRTGDDILLDGELHTVEAVSGTSIRLANVVGEVSAVSLGELLANPGFALASSAGAAAPLPPSGLLDGIPDEEAGKARWWERHGEHRDISTPWACRGSLLPGSGHAMAG